MANRIGVYICHCGTNIAGKVDSEGVARYAATLRNVAVGRDYKFMCSDPGQEMIIRDIREMGLNRVVVASCSPRMHEKTFQNACRRAGLNPFLFQMACIREHCSWVTDDPVEATAKAMHLVAAAVERVNHHRDLHTRQVGVHPDVMVVGAGIAGIQAALDVAKSGHQVHLVEKRPSIGGHMMKFDKTFPTLDCAACISTPKTVAVAQEPNINMLTYSEVTEVNGFVGNYQVTVKRHPRYVLEDKCTGCGLCAEACPVEMVNEFDEGLSTRKAIYRYFPQAVPQTFRIEKYDRAPCTMACPAGINVQGYVQLVKQGKYEQALRLIMEKAPLPGVLGRVCPHPCEAQCRRLEVDEAVSIRELKRVAADNVDLDSLPLPAIKDKDKRVAVIGSGPAGLSSAYYLRLMGYRVTIFEAAGVLGGMLRTGIPDYRLPPEVLEREIAFLLRHGIEARTGVRLGRDVTLQGLAKDGYAAVFLGIGAQGGVRLGIPGEEADGVVDAVRFLREVNLGERTAAGPRVAVVGGGNVAIDAARVARRLGCAEVTLVYRRTEAEMPAYREEIEGCREEGVNFLNLASPVAVVLENGKVTGLRCIRNELGPADESGRRRPVPVEGSEFVLECDTVVPAIGQSIEADWAADDPDLETTRRGTFHVSRRMQTSIPYVFAAGDAVSGPATVIEAMASGRKAADSIHCYLQGLPLETERATEDETAPDPSYTWAAVPSGTCTAARERPAHMDPAERTECFLEECHGLTNDQATAEAERCLNCGGCCECLECVRACEVGAVDHNMTEQTLTLDVGSIILATGFHAMDPEPLRQYGFGRYPEVYSALQFERLNNATGPTGGKIRMKDGRKPESLAFIHCVGSRDANYHEYCSRVCCMYALKYAHLVKDKVGHDTRVHNFYIDMRCFGKGYEEFYRRVQEEGVTFVRGRPAEVVQEDGKLVVVSEDTLSGRILRVPVDMVVLCTAMEPSEDVQEVARVFGVSVGQGGFLLEEHPKLGPVSTATDGVFLAGTCQGPKDIPDAVSHAAGAAAQSLALASRGTVEISPVTSWINPDICVGCKICMGLCAYSAIEFDHRRNVSVVNEAMCKGCGSCAGHCPSGAAQIKHFTGPQVFNELDGLLDPLPVPGRRAPSETAEKSAPAQAGPEPEHDRQAA